MDTDKRRRARLAYRRRLYTGGALLVVAPLAGVGASCGRDLVIAPVDTRRDAGPVDSTVIAPILSDVGFMIAPMDVDAGVRPDAQVIAIAPMDVDAAVPRDAQIIAIAPLEVDAGVAPDAGPRTGGLGAQCSADGECQQEYSCQTPICIVACPGSCEPLACGTGCPTGAQCVPFAGVDTCVRDPGGTPGGYGAGCTADGDCSPQFFCQNTCSMCIVPVMECVPMACDADAGGQCPSGSTCEDVGIAKVCVRK